MKNLEIDIETYSSVSLQKCGVYKYAESPDFEILLLAQKLGYSIYELPVKIINHRESKVHVVRDTFRMLRAVAEMKKRIQ